MDYPMTITEKILANSAGKKTVRTGEIVESNTDLVYTMDFLGKVLFEHLKDLGVKQVFNKDKVVIIFDHLTPAANENSADLQKYVRKAAQEYNVTLYDVGRHGIMHQVIAEEGHVLPGNLVVGTDSHTPTAGALGALVTGVGATDAAVAMATGKLWLKVPEQIKVNVTGEFKKGVSSRDLVFSLIKEKGWDGTTGDWAYKTIEFTGETIEKMSISKRLTATNLISDMGAKNAIIAPDQKTVEYLKSIGVDSQKINMISSDKDAHYEEVVNIDVTELEPVIACPHSPDNVKNVSEVEGTKIDQAVIASCSNARLEDLRDVANILKGKKINDKTRMIISPASQSIYKQAAKEGLLEIFVEAGALVGPPTCGPCFGGQMGVLSSDEICITSTPRNMQGRMGSKSASIYSANPETIAASAINGYITDPREFIGGV